MSTIAATFAGLDNLADATVGRDQIPSGVVIALFMFLSLRSRLFSPLSNKRPDLKKAVQGEETGGFNDRVMPSWTPPGVTFPIMWVLVVAPLRAFSTSLVWGGTCLEIDYEAIQSTSCAFVPCSEWSRALRPSDPHTYTASQVSPHRSALVFCSSSACLHQHR